MWRLARKEPRFPKSFYERAQHLTEQARNEPDPEIRKVQLAAIAMYYQSDVRQREPFFATLLTLVLVYLVVIGTAFYSFRNFSFLSSVAIVIASYAILAFLVGAAFRAAGYIGEASFMEIFKAGLRALLLMRKQADKE